MQIYKSICKRQLVYSVLFSLFLFIFTARISAQQSSSAIAPIPPIAPIAPVVPLSINPVSSQSAMPNTNGTIQTSSSSSTRNGETQPTTPQTQNGMELSAANLSSLANTLMGGGGTNTEALSTLLNNAGLGGNELGSIAGLANQTGLGTNPATAQILQQILERLDQIQQTVNAQNPQSTHNTQGVQSNQQLSALQSQTGGKILRFMVNNYNILDTCQTIFFSGLSEDGSFLLTGDREYHADGLTRSETFYLLFNKINSTEFDVACTVSQDYENKNSFLYQLSQKEQVRASQTGNFVTVHLNEPQWKMDLLIDCNYSQPMEDIEP